MARRDYFTQACPEPWQVLGIRLLPFSLGHYIKLRFLECAFVADDPKSATLYDLLIGVAVCSMPSEPEPTTDQFWQWFYGNSKPSRALQIRNMVATVFRQPKLSPAEYEMMKWGKWCGAFDFPEKVQLFSKYIKAHSTIPGFWEKPSEEPATSGAHWSQGILAALCAKGNYDQRLALNVPLSKAIFDFYKILENEGAGRMMTQEELEMTGGMNGD